MTRTLMITHLSLTWTLAMSLVMLACTDDAEPEDHSGDPGATETNTPSEGDGDDVPGDGDSSPGNDIDPGDGDGDEGEIDSERIEAACTDLCTLVDSCESPEPGCEDECLEMFNWFGPECARPLVSMSECIAALDCAGYDAWLSGDPFDGPDYPCKDEDLAVLACPSNSSAPRERRRWAQRVSGANFSTHWVNR
ncbi:MAG: hypothetical protein R6X02_25610 [Enhygromyxa sp.]